MFVGDITCFDKQFVEARCGENYDFSYEFEKVSPIFSEADLVVGNLETMIVPEAPYRSEKHVSEQNFHCNAPNEFLDALRKAGIDVLTNANNHSLDTGTIGIGETIDNIVRFGFIQTGTFKTEKKRYEIIDVAGFKIAIVAFTMEHNNKKCNLTSDGIEFLLNDYSPEKARKIINDAHGDGAELVFTCIHWGSENKCVQNNVQIKTANELADMGYDCIIGSHPHVLQPFNFINTNNKKVPVFYSMGNFISHNANNQKSRSIIACVELKRQEKNISMTCSYIPVFTSDNYGDKKYIVLPINNLVFDSRNRKRLVKIKKTIGKEIKINKNIQFSEYVEKEEAESLSEVSQEISEIDVSSITEYPVEYHDKKFTYLIYKEYAYITGFFGESSVGAWSIPEKIGDLPIKGISEGAFSQNQIVKKLILEKILLLLVVGCVRTAERLKVSNLEAVRLKFKMKHLRSALV